VKRPLKDITVFPDYRARQKFGDRFELRLPGPAIHLTPTGSGFRYPPKPGNGEEAQRSAS
jgi:hypothetical protein